MKLRGGINGLRQSKNATIKVFASTGQGPARCHLYRLYVLMLLIRTRHPQKSIVENQLSSSRLQAFYPPSLKQIKAAVTSLK